MIKTQLVTAPKYVKASICFEDEKKGVEGRVPFFAELTNAIVDAPYRYKGENFISLEYSVIPIIKKDSFEKIISTLKKYDVIDDEEDFFEICNEGNSGGIEIEVLEPHELLELTEIKNNKA